MKRDRDRESRELGQRQRAVKRDIDAERESWEAGQRQREQGSCTEKGKEKERRERKGREKNESKTYGADIQHYNLSLIHI